ncbi:hypothetical protein LH935_28485 (plasmid) [Gordonia polyisoprenivorans]|uniref:hypothetical protein n=1 Tax=Gordonia polyisoprenivorans TaxID=84595 RepID=UPI002234948C|nr:hypothetical protein LH935_28485 [Gordonia polyisoprenivorans]
MAASRSASADHPVVLVERWTDSGPPAELPVRGPLRTRHRIVIVMLLVAATTVGTATVVALWTTPTPGWWFSLLFTSLSIVLVGALWLGYVGAVAQSSERARASHRWAEANGNIVGFDGTVAARTVSVIEDGTIESFTLTVKTLAGQVHAAWERRTGRSPMLLQTQVPGVGARARVWRIVGAEESEPMVIEVQDPTTQHDPIT